MGKQSSKIKDILYVTGSDLDPPEYKIQRKYVPTKQPKTDFNGFIPRKYYKEDATEAQVEQHQNKLKDKQNLLKLFKYYKQFDRIDFNVMRENCAPFEIQAEQNIKWWFFSGALVAQLLQVHLLNEYYTFGGFGRYTVKVLIMLFPFMLYKFAFLPEYHIINHQYFRHVDNQTSFYQQLNYQLNLFKDVQDIKYSYKFPSVKKYYQTKREFFDRHQATIKGQAKEYFEYYNGLKLDKYEQFIKERQKSRKASSDILSEADKEMIKSDLNIQK